MAHATSARNGLQIGVPPDARGVINRFRTAGDNELVFDQNKMDTSLPKGFVGKTMKLDSPTAKVTEAKPAAAAPRQRRRSTSASADLV